MPSQGQIIQSLKNFSDKQRKFVGQINHIKNIFKKKYPDASDIQLKYSPMIPSLWISSKINGKTQVTHIRQFLLNKNQADRPGPLDRIYSNIYLKVKDDYRGLIQFALHRGKDLNKNRYFTKKSIMSMYQYNNKKHLFYCCQYVDKYGQMFGFSLFDRNFVNVEFDSLFIQSKKDQYQDQYEQYLDLIYDYFPLEVQKKQIKKQQKPKQKQKQKHQYVQKAPDNISKNKKYTQKKQDRLDAILNKNLSKYQKKLDQMYSQYENLKKNYQFGHISSQNDLQILDQQIYQLEKSLDNFNQTINDIKKTISKKKNKKGVLKRAIIAEKQLDSKLPIISRKSKIMKELEENDLIILQGQTGSGKSTQLPQFLCEYFNLFDNEDALPVLITQPRKLAARTIAERVAEELEEKVGEFVDFVDTQAKKQSQSAKIIFKLDRIALDDLIEDEALRDYSCLVLDEAHQRTMNIDVIVGLINKLFGRISAKRRFKVIITSASMDVKLFEDYFREYGLNIRFNTIKVPGRMYPVKIKYFDYQSIKQSIMKISKIIDEEIIPYEDQMKQQLQGNILVFCTNIDQINILVQKYAKKLDPKNFKVFPLHGKLLPQEQAEIFKSTKQFKLIFATRMAETAITIDGVTVVVDPGEDMKKVFDQNFKISSMKLMKISQSTAKQRAGRAGRTSSGFCFRLYSEQYLSTCPPNQKPQILNESLQSVVLRLKQLKLKNLTKFQFIQPPSPQGLEASEQILKLISCLDEDGNLNSIGRLLIKIPMEPFLSRAIAQSLIYESILKNNKTDQGLLDHLKKKDLNKMKSQPISQTVVEILCMIINSDLLFYTNQDTRENSDRVKFQQFSQQSGDFFYLQNIYDKFINIYHSTEKQYKIKQFLNKYFLSLKTLRQVNKMHKQIQSILKKQGQINLRLIRDQTLQKCKQKMKKCNSYDQLVLSCLFSSFCAHLCLYSQHPQIGYTLLCRKFPIRIYGTSNLTLQGIAPKWIVCYNLIQNASGQVYCKIAQEVKEQFFQKQIIDGYVFQKFEIKRLMKSNPFYIRKQYKVSTCIYNKVYQAYLKRREYGYFADFSERIQILFTEDNQKVTLFVYVDNADGQKQVQKFQLFLKNLQKHLDEIQRYNYLGSCKILFDKSFNIYDIQFISQEYILELSKLNKIQFNFIFNNCYGYGKIQPISSDTIYIYLDQQHLANALNQYLSSYKNYGRFHSKVIKTIKNHHNPNQQILMYYYAGYPSQYQTQCVRLGGYDPETIYENKFYLCQAIETTKKHKGYHFNISSEIKIVTISKAKTTIILQTRLDEFNIEEIIQYLLKNQNCLDRKFIYPQYIFKNRIPQYPEALYSNQQWKRRIHKCLSKYINPNQYNLQIYQVNKHHSPYNQERISLCAKLKTQDKKVYQILYENMNDKAGFLGVGKVHIRCNYSILVCTIPYQAFQYYQQECFRILQNQKLNGKMVDIIYSRADYQSENIQIYIFGHKKKHLFSALKYLKTLFVPKIIKLNKLQSEVMKVNQSQIIQQFKQNYYLNFNFNYKQKTIVIYCYQEQIQEIERNFKKSLANKNLKSNFISYKGKNLHKVMEILRKHEQRQEKQDFTYRIEFMKWGVVLSGKLENIQECSQEINELSQSINPSCQICQDIIRTPFVLHNCKHVFCWQCLVRIIRQWKNNENQEQLVCPYSAKRKDCSTKISYFDIKILFSSYEFRQICDYRILQYVDKNNNKYLICKNCGQISELEYLSKDQDCNFCGHINQNHKNH